MEQPYLLDITGRKYPIIQRSIGLADVFQNCLYKNLWGLI